MVDRRKVMAVMAGASLAPLFANLPVIVASPGVPPQVQDPAPHRAILPPYEAGRKRSR